MENLSAKDSYNKLFEKLIEEASWCAALSSRKQVLDSFNKIIFEFNAFDIIHMANEDNELCSDLFNRIDYFLENAPENDNKKRDWFTWKPGPSGRLRIEPYVNYDLAASFLMWVVMQFYYNYCHKGIKKLISPKDFLNRYVWLINSSSYHYWNSKYAYFNILDCMNKNDIVKNYVMYTKNPNYII